MNKLRLRTNSIIYILAIILVAVLFPTDPVYALDKTVTISEVSPSTSVVKVNGTTEADAVMIQLRNASGDDIIAMKSFPVVDNAFEGSITDITLSEGIEYTVYVADYEGGDFATESFIIESEEEVTTEATTEATTETTTQATTEATAEVKDTKTVKAAKTGDNALVAFMFMTMIVSGLGIFLIIRKVRKGKQ